MPRMAAPPFIDQDVTEELCRTIVRALEDKNFRPDLIIGLATGGMYPAMRIGKMMGVELVSAVPVRKMATGVREICPIVRPMPGLVATMKVLGIDDVVVSGKLLRDLSRTIARLGATFQPAALVGVGSRSRINNLIVAENMTTTPQFFWEKDE